MGWILPGTRLDKRGRPATIVGRIAPLEWAGCIRFADADSDVAHVVSGMVVDVRSRRVVAELAIGERRPWSWKTSSVDRRLWRAGGDVAAHEMGAAHTGAAPVSIFHDAYTSKSPAVTTTGEVS